MVQFLTLNIFNDKYPNVIGSSIFIYILLCVTGHKFSNIYARFNFQ